LKPHACAANLVSLELAPGDLGAQAQSRHVLRSQPRLAPTGADVGYFDGLVEQCRVRDCIPKDLAAAFALGAIDDCVIGEGLPEGAVVFTMIIVHHLSGHGCSF
jgi:hypothetical protein